MNSTVLFIIAELLLAVTIVLLILTMKKVHWVNIISIVLLVATMIIVYVSFKGFAIETVEEFYTNSSVPASSVESSEMTTLPDSSNVTTETTTGTTDANNSSIDVTNEPSNALQDDIQADETDAISSDTSDIQMTESNE